MLKGKETGTTLILEQKVFSGVSYYQTITSTLSVPQKDLFHKMWSNLLTESDHPIEFHNNCNCAFY